VPSAAQQNRVLAEVLRVLRPGGTLIASDSLPSTQMKAGEPGPPDRHLQVQPTARSAWSASRCSGIAPAAWHMSRAWCPRRGNRVLSGHPIAAAIPMRGAPMPTRTARTLDAALER